MSASVITASRRSSICTLPPRSAAIPTSSRTVCCKRRSPAKEFTAADENMCAETAQQSTSREQAADNCERDIDKLFIAAYMKQFIGEEFDARYPACSRSASSSPSPTAARV